MDVVEAHLAAGGPAGLAAHGLVAASVGDPAELLHVDVDEFAGPFAFVAADDLTGRAVDPGRPLQPVAGEDPVDGGRWMGQSQDRADPGGPELAGPPQVAALFFDGNVICQDGQVLHSSRSISTERGPQ